MSEIQRICAQCGASAPLGVRYCGSCGYDFQGEMVVRRNNLPAVVSQAAVPVLLGAAGFVLRAGWKALQSRWAQAAAEQAANLARNTPQPLAKSAPPPTPASRLRRTMTIRSTWAMGDANGIWRRGYSEQHIELDD